MTRGFSKLLLAASLVVFGAGEPVLGQAGQAQFDRTGAGSISGLIVTDDAQPRPLRRAIVTIEEASTLIQPRVVTSDEDGGYVFRNLPPGRYRISATRPPYVRGVYGAKRVAGPAAVLTGTMVVVGQGQVVTNINVVLSRGSVITGMVRDIDGQPARSFRVNAYYFVRAAATGERTLMAAASAVTDDRGAYRMYGLRPGSYVVALASSSSPSAQDGTLQSEIEVARALDLVQRSGMASATAMPTNPTAPPPRKPTVGYVPVFFPGVTDAAQATPVVVGVGEERNGIDITMQLVPTARLEVMVSFPDSRNKPRAQLRVTPTGVSLAGGPIGFSTYSVNDETPTFIPGLAPGTYLVTASTVPTAPDAPMLTATAEIRAEGADQAITLPLQPGISLSGRLIFDGSTVKPPSDLTRIRVFANPAAGVASVPGAGTSTNLTANGEFTLTNMRPGRYRLEATLPLPPHESGWYPKSVSLAGQDAYEGWAEVRAGVNVTGAVITMTDRPTEISGTMTDATGAPAPEYFMIAFSADQAHWIPNSRRIQQVRPASDGLFVFRHLPPGEYRLAAVVEIQEGEWSDPEFLARLVEASIKITLTEGAKVRQDIRIAR